MDASDPRRAPQAPRPCDLLRRRNRCDRPSGPRQADRRRRERSRRAHAHSRRSRRCARLAPSAGGPGGPAGHHRRDRARYGAAATPVQLRERRDHRQRVDGHPGCRERRVSHRPHHHGLRGLEASRRPCHRPEPHPGRERRTGAADARRRRRPQPDGRRARPDAGAALRRRLHGHDCRGRRRARADHAPSDPARAHRRCGDRVGHPAQRSGRDPHHLGPRAQRGRHAHPRRARRLRRRPPPPARSPRTAPTRRPDPPSGDGGGHGDRARLQRSGRDRGRGPIDRGVDASRGDHRRG